MYCTQCGKEIAEGARFCVSCGYEIVAVPTTAPSLGQARPAMTERAVTPAPSYGGFWARFAAFLIDSLILGIPGGIIFLAVVFLFGGFGVLFHQSPPSDPRELMAFFGPLLLVVLVASLFSVILHWLYYAAMESSARQATLGKSLLSLRVASSEGRRLSFGHATGRYFAKLISGLIPFAIGYIMAAFTAKKQALHDLIAGTLVLKS